MFPKKCKGTTSRYFKYGTGQRRVPDTNVRSDDAKITTLHYVVLITATQASVTVTGIRLFRKQMAFTVRFALAKIFTDLAERVSKKKYLLKLEPSALCSLNLVTRSR
jgi:hypothetical protein